MFLFIPTPSHSVYKFSIRGKETDIMEYHKSFSGGRDVLESATSVRDTLFVSTRFLVFRVIWVLLLSLSVMLNQ